MKRLLNNKRELLPEWIELQELMNSCGEYLAVLELSDSPPDLAKFKRNALVLREKIRIFTNEKIEPIRIKMRSRE